MAGVGWGYRQLAGSSEQALATTALVVAATTAAANLEQAPAASSVAGDEGQAPVPKLQAPAATTMYPAGDADPSGSAGEVAREYGNSCWDLEQATATK